jgi:hypothetical protein
MPRDDVRVALEELAAFVHPTLQPDDYPPIGAVVAQEAREHDAHARFMQAIAFDPALAAFAPPNDHAWIETSFGVGSRLDSGQLLAAGARSMQVTSGGIGSRDAYVDAVTRALMDFRRLVGGSVGVAPVVIAFERITVAPDTWLDTPWGRLRPATVADQPPYRTPFGNPTAVLVSSVPVRIAVGSLGHADTGDADTFTQIDRIARKFSLAVVLGVRGRSVQPVPFRAWAHVFVPCALGSQSTMSTLRQATLAELAGRHPGYPPLTDAERECFDAAAAIVEAHYDPVLDVATSRLIQAIASRADPADALIDATISLESLLSSDRVDDATFRVTCGAAALLEKDPAARMARQAVLQKMYSTRSKVVHGRPVSHAEITHQAGVAINSATDALSALLTQYPHLIPDGKRRAMRILLGDV